MIIILRIYYIMVLRITLFYLWPSLLLHMHCTPHTRGMLHRLNSQSFGRRSSFLYQSDADEDHDDDAAGMGDTGISRTSSMSSHVGDETYITPFAQVRRERGERGRGRGRERERERERDSLCLSSLLLLLLLIDLGHTSSSAFTVPHAHGPPGGHKDDPHTPGVDPCPFPKHLPPP